MHPKNPFFKDYDFELLIQHYAPLNEFVFVNTYGSTTIKFGDKQAIKALNTGLLKAHYGIDWDIPEHNLCPPIPGRLDYLLHISDLFVKHKIRMLDIGTGANLIYPILASCHLKWECAATEVDRDSLRNALEIINKNSCLKGIDLRPQPYKNNILENVIKPDDIFDVVVCNPPFFKNRHDAQAKNLRKTKNLGLDEKESLNFGGHSNELWYKGGEEAFIKKMIGESVGFIEQVHWFTVLVSQIEHLKNIKRAVNKTNPAEVRVVPMALGNKKSRFIAWRYR